MSTITTIKDLCCQYYDEFITWYNAADDVIQIAVLVCSGVAILFIMGIIFISKLTKC